MHGWNLSELNIGNPLGSARILVRYKLAVRYLNQR